MKPLERPDSKTRLLDAALTLVRSKGYAATSVDDICKHAGVTKGSFFHHFKSKDDLAVAAVGHFSAMADGLFGTAPYRAAEDPLDRVLGYVDFRAQILQGELYEYTCLLGTLVQETYDTHPALRAACDEGLSAHVGMLMEDIEAARRRHVPRAKWTAESVGYFIQAVLQGSFIFAKAKQGPEVVHGNIAHLRRYLLSLFDKEEPSRRKKP